MVRWAGPRSEGSVMTAIDEGGSAEDFEALLAVTGSALAGSVHAVADEREEAEAVAASIETMLGGASFHALDSRAVDARDQVGHQLSFADFAVLYRTSSQAGAIPVSSTTNSRLPAPEAPATTRPVFRYAPARCRWSRATAGSRGLSGSRQARRGGTRRRYRSGRPPRQRTTEQVSTRSVRKPSSSRCRSRGCGSERAPWNGQTI